MYPGRVERRTKPRQPCGHNAWLTTYLQSHALVMHRITVLHVSIRMQGHMRKGEWQPGRTTKSCADHNRQHSAGSPSLPALPACW